MRSFKMIILCLLVSIISLAAPKKEPTKIVFYTPAEDASGAIRRLVNKFNSENSGVIVEHKMLSSGTDDCRNYYVTACLSKDNSFDVFSGDIIWIS
ncbi:MAG TPA: hypothetical protein DDW93_00410, partial [Firmicutes bacterium]|nr:hypothetical protein [Bacillota bacterium]